MKNDTTEELQVGDEINVNILTGIGNVMMSSSKQSDINENDVDVTIDREKVSEVIRSTHDSYRRTELKNSRTQELSDSATALSRMEC